MIFYILSRVPIVPESSSLRNAVKIKVKSLLEGIYESNIMEIYEDGVEYVYIVDMAMEEDE